MNSDIVNPIPHSTATPATWPHVAPSGSEAMRLFTYQALRAANHLEIGGGGRGEIHKISAASVMFAADTLNRVLDDALQIHGGSGYIWETEINRLYRTIKLLEIGAGTTEVRKLIIADELLRE